ncbi:MAG: hypothetical protein EXR94_10750 [Gemmatimonadetes bacterium]|nr:hypothetical protein [Gemmatimonadota bacterium]
MGSVIGRLGFAMAVLGVALGALPKKAMAHCRPEPTQSAPGHHDHGSENTDSAPECPHCPPVECRRHVECATALDTMVVTRSPIPVPASDAQAIATPGNSGATGHPSPPTPPPQLTL